MDARELHRRASQSPGPIGRAIDGALIAISVLAHAVILVG
jgi:hypothetical protein